MATVQLTPTTLTVHLTLGERIAGLVRRDVTVPLSAVRSAEVAPDALAAVRGLRAPGLALPGVVRIGTWRRSGERSFVCVRTNQPAVRIRLEGQHVDTVLVGADDADGLAGRITAAAG